MHSIRIKSRSLAKTVCRNALAVFLIVLVFVVCSGLDATVSAQTNSDTEQTAATNSPKSLVETENLEPFSGGDIDLKKVVEDATQPEQFSGMLKAALTLGVLSLAPAILLMTTCYIRVVVVLSLLKQALGGQNLPPTQVVTALALFVTMLIMTPVWQDIKKDAVDPYSNREITWQQAWEQGTTPIKRFMSRQIEMGGNQNDVMMFYQYLPEDQKTVEPKTYSDVPLQVLLPAFIISELKIAFLIGFQVFLPFLVVDLVVSSVTISMGMFMLPPAMISLPLKLILFVMVDGWNLVIGMLLESFAPYT